MRVTHGGEIAGRPVHERVRVDRVTADAVNGYVIGDDLECALVDAPGDGSALLAAVGARRVTRVLLTHGHRAHVRAALTVADATRAPVLLHPDDLMLWRETFPDVWPDRELLDGTTYEVAGVGLRAIHVPGHTPGGTCFHAAATGDLFAGDTLAGPGTGRLLSHAADPSELVSQVRARLFTLPPDTLVHPGHGRAVRIASLRWEREFWS